MSDAVIHVENLSKKYTIGHQQSAPSRTIRDAVTKTGRSFLQRLRSPFQPSAHDPAYEDFWALKDICFEINQGDRVGIIGRNGAGKSTLLKVLSRITEPTSGQVRIKGRVASLLEVGTGFHPELTGRENVFLNGAILGMSKVEIRQKFDEIVAFAEVEKFLDTPVKRYSSGMYVRLAFAVAAHLEPEILVVDEVLAVGDAQFQQKCLGKMEDVASEGRTVIFVSHNMGSMMQLCNQGIWLASGQVVEKGSINTIVSHYLGQGKQQKGGVQLLSDLGQRKQTKKFFFSEVKFQQQGTDSLELDVRHPFTLELGYEITQDLTNLELSVRVHTSEGITVLTTCQSDLSPDSLEFRPTGTYHASIKFPGMFLMPGSYMLTIVAHIPMIEMLDMHEYVMPFTIAETGSRFAQYGGHQNIGVIIADLPWLENKI